MGKSLTKGNKAFEIQEDFKPQAGEKIYDKTINSDLRYNGLLVYLREIGETEVMIAGLKTDDG